MAIQDYLSGIQSATSGAKQDVSNAAKDLSTLQVGAGALPAKLKEALNTKLNNNKDIINQQSETMQNYFNSGAEARNKYQDVFDPFKKAELVQQERSMALRPYDTLSGVLENRMGDVNDIVQSGIQGWQGMVDSASTKAELAKFNLSNALQEYMQAADMQQSADQMDMQQSQFDKNYGLDVQKFNESVRQFDKEYALKQLQLSGGTGGKNAENTLSAWQQAVESGTNPDGSVNEGKVWNYINQNDSMLRKAGVNVDDLWSAHSRLADSQKSTTTVGKPNTKMQDTLSSLWDNSKYWLSSGQVK